MNGILAYALYFVGDLCSRFDGPLDGRFGTGALYQWAMRKSNACQDRAGWGPWKDMRP